MSGKRRLFLLIAVSTTMTVIVIGVAMVLLYQSAFKQQQSLLIDTVKSRASLINAIANYDRNSASIISALNLDFDPSEATLCQLRKAHLGYDGLGETGEFTLAKRKGDQIVFLLRHRHHDFDNPHPVVEGTQDNDRY